MLTRASIGVAMDTGITHDDYWKPILMALKISRMDEKQNHSVIFLVYNDHCTAFDARCIPTFALGCGAEFQPADEGGGPRPVPL